jgi:hypothetical protein
MKERTVKTISAVVLMLVLCGVAVYAAVSEQTTTTFNVAVGRALDGGGAWQITTPVKAARTSTMLSATSTGTGQWRVRGTRTATDRAAGRLTFIGSDGSTIDGNVRARINGRTVWGEVVDDNGKLLATFEGVVSTTGLRGRFTLRDDSQGAWSWDG